MFTIPDSMLGSLDCAARELQSPGYSVDTVTNATMPQAVDGLRKSSITVLRHILARMKTRREKSREFFLPDLNLHYKPVKPNARLG